MLALGTSYGGLLHKEFSVHLLGGHTAKGYTGQIRWMRPAPAGMHLRIAPCYLMCRAETREVVREALLEPGIEPLARCSVSGCIQQRPSPGQ